MKKLSLIIISVVICIAAIAQQDLMVSQYTFNHAYINPAACGITESYNASLMYRNQWVQFDGAPVSQFISVDGPVISKNMGLGILLQREQIGINTQTEMFGNYSYIIDMDNIKISMGLRAGLSIFEAKYRDHIAVDAGDELLAENTVSYLPNFGFGFYLKHENYFASIGIPHILNYDPTTNLKLDIEYSNQLVRHYYLMGGYSYQLNEDFTLEPSTLFKYVPNAPAQMDVNILAEYKHLVSLGVGYRTDNSIIILSKFNVYKDFQLGYSFDITTANIRHYSKGSHEIMLSYKFGEKKSGSAII